MFRTRLKGEDKKIVPKKPCCIGVLIRKPSALLPSAEELPTIPSGLTHPLLRKQIFTLLACMVAGDISIKVSSHITKARRVFFASVQILQEEP